MPKPNVTAKIKGTRGPLIDGFSKAGAEFADVMRMYLPRAVFLQADAAAHARSVMNKAAGTATAKMNSASSKWLATGQLSKAVVAGQRQAASSIGVAFGGVNTRLVTRLRHDVALDLSRAAHSTNAYLNVQMRMATAWAKQRESSLVTKPLMLPVNEAISKSLLASAQEQELYRKASQRMLKALGMVENDKVLFLSGYRMDAEVYSKLLVRTRTMEALNLGKATELTENGYEFIETSEHADVDPKDICYFLQGKVWALQPNDKGIPVLPEEYGLPPWHPNCEHTFGAWQPAFEGGAKAVEKVVESHADDRETLDAFGGKIALPSSHTP